MLAAAVLASLLVASQALAAPSPAPAWKWVDEPAPVAARAAFGRTNASPVTSSSWPSQCVSSSGTYVMPTGDDGKPKLVAYKDAVQFCSAIAGNGFATLGDETTANADEFAALVNSCAPSSMKAWISSWNGDTYNYYPIFMMKRWDDPSKYGVYVDLIGDEPKPFICTKKQM
ncbi:hypothetical protein DFJ73DRAFT_810009 [Zopfochytrium polystomum]|nr:hypothetical protein DFJ73DRAFT_810009 [Zopfochytrium polystomum]